jgi:glucose-6-phosphate 1-dehydrogenase
LKSACVYDSTGALRDMVQNHALQLLCAVAMEPPVTPAPTRFAMKAEGAALKPWTPQTLSQHVIRSQYAARQRHRE